MSAGTIAPRMLGISSAAARSNSSRALASSVMTLSPRFCMTATESASAAGTSDITRFCMAIAAAVTAALSGADRRSHTVFVTTVAPTSGATRMSSMNGVAVWN
jgi:hypothetical protein